MNSTTLTSKLMAAVSILSIVAAGGGEAYGELDDGGGGGILEATSATNYDADFNGNGTNLLAITPLALMSKHGGTSGGTKHQEDVSPVTLSTEWPRLARLLLLASLSVIGSIGNVFMISSVMIEDHLKKAGKHHRWKKKFIFS